MRCLFFELFKDIDSTEVACIMHSSTLCYFLTYWPDKYIINLSFICHSLALNLILIHFTTIFNFLFKCLIMMSWNFNNMNNSNHTELYIHKKKAVKLMASYQMWYYLKFMPFVHNFMEARTIYDIHLHRNPKRLMKLLHKAECVCL